MTLNKSIEHGKVHRKQYTGAKAVDKTCRNHGSCAWCEENRKHSRTKREMAADQDMQEFMEENAYG